MDIPRTTDFGSGNWDPRVTTVDALAKRTEREIELSTLPIVGNPRELGGGSNTVLLVSFEGGSRGVFKPGDGERRLEIPESRGKLFKREAAAYLVSCGLNFNLVPPTVLREISGREGSIQDFVTDPKNSIWEVDESEVAEQLFELSIFDYVIWNKDRKVANFFIKDKAVLAADNGLSFDDWFQYLISDNLSEYVLGKPVPDKLITNIRSFLNSNKDQEEIRSKLSPLVPDRAVDTMFERVKKVHRVLAKGRVSEHDIRSMEYNPI